VDDVIIGAIFADPGGVPSAGKSYVVFGRESFGACCLSGSLCGDLSAALGIFAPDFGCVTPP
jgi:hypothetical protein